MPLFMAKFMLSLISLDGGAILRNANETSRGFAFQHYISLRQHKGPYLMREQREKLSVIQGHISPFHHYGKKKPLMPFLKVNTNTFPMEWDCVHTRQILTTKSSLG